MDGNSVLVQPLRQEIFPPPSLSGTSPGQGGKVNLLRSVARLIAIGGLSLTRFLVNTGLFNNQGMIILSQHEHANFAATDLRRVKTLITLRRLNMVKHLEMFLNSLAHILPPDTNFVGCFCPSKVHNPGTGNPGRSYSFTGRFFHSGRQEWNALNRRMVSDMLERNGLTLISMAEMNGVTWFHSRRMRGHASMQPEY